MTRVTSADGTRIALESVGSGRPVILVDGAMCFRDSGPMRPIATALARSAMVVLYDRRGRGASGDRPPYAVSREIDDLVALIDAVGGRASLFGISSGAALAARAAAVLHDGVDVLVAFEPPYLPAEASAAARAYTGALVAALDAGDRDAAVAAFLRHVGTPEEAIAAMRRGGPGWAGMAALAPTLRYDDLVMDDSAVPEEARSITARTLTLAGTRSPGILQWGARALADAVPGAAFASLDGQGHDADPAVLAAALATFLGS